MFVVWHCCIAYLYKFPMSVSYVLENLFSRLEIVVCRNEFERSALIRKEEVCCCCYSWCWSQHCSRKQQCEKERVRWIKIARRHFQRRLAKNSTKRHAIRWFPDPARKKQLKQTKKEGETNPCNFYASNPSLQYSLVATYIDPTRYGVS